MLLLRCGLLLVAIGLCATSSNAKGIPSIPSISLLNAYLLAPAPRTCQELDQTIDFDEERLVDALKLIKSQKEFPPIELHNPREQGDCRKRYKEHRELYEGQEQKYAEAHELLKTMLREINQHVFGNSNEIEMVNCEVGWMGGTLARSYYSQKIVAFGLSKIDEILKDKDSYTDPEAVIWHHMAHEIAHYVHEQYIELSADHKSPHGHRPQSKHKKRPKLKEKSFKGHLEVDAWAMVILKEMGKPYTGAVEWHERYQTFKESDPRAKFVIESLRSFTSELDASSNSK